MFTLILLIFPACLISYYAIRVGLWIVGVIAIICFIEKIKKKIKKK